MSENAPDPIEETWERMARGEGFTFPDGLNEVIAEHAQRMLADRRAARDSRGWTRPNSAPTSATWSTSTPRPAAAGS